MTAHHVVYRAPATMIGGLAIGMALVIVLLLVRAADEVAGGVLLWAGLVGAALFGLVLAVVVRTVTVVSGEGITVRQLFGTRSYLWAEIVDIRIARMSGTRYYSAVVYDRDGRQVLLPQVTDKVLGAERLDHEVGELRRRWEAVRGPGTDDVGSVRTRFWTVQRTGIAIGFAAGITVAVLMAALN
ncbi:MAG TPA: PH domain-containing protein [Actinophytocola sp.]|nr:PH domain-containing protein [Actinophytocola sp.]